MKTKIKAEKHPSSLNGPACYILPADAASVERMVEQMAEGMHAARWNTNLALTQEEYARAALAAIGIK